MANLNSTGKKIVILKTGQKLPTLDGVPGDFEDWILSGMGASQTDAWVVAAHAGDFLPDLSQVRAVLITGSAAMVTDHADWIERAVAWVAEIVQNRIPLLGICFGHQLLARALGGVVDYNPKGIEVGTVALHMTEEARQDPLLSGLANNTRVHVSHRQSVLTLPPQAVLLASTYLDAHNSFRVGDVAWGVQFHPEFNAQIVRGYVEYFKSGLETEHKNVDQLLSNCQDTQAGDMVLRRFFRVVRDHEIL